MSLPSATYEVRLPAFEGPLDLLLQLVERNNLPVTDVALAQVTDGYLRRVEGLQVTAEEMSHFLVVASRLLLLKSRSLLPRRQVEEPDSQTEELAEQLRTYQRFKAAAAALRDLEGRTCYTQLLPPPVPADPTTPISLPLAALERALQRSLRRLEAVPPQGSPVSRMRLRLADVVGAAERIIARDGYVRLDSLLGPGRGRTESILAFLAALDLVRRRRAHAVQEGLFAPILLYPAEEVE